MPPLGDSHGQKRTGAMSTRVTERPRRGFTLVEILVVIAIVMLASVVALPTLLPMLNGRHLSEAARIFTASLAGVKDAAIRANEPRGLRLLPDPVLTIPAPGSVGAGSLQLCYNRMVPIEPAADYSEGMVSIGPQLSPGAAGAMTGVFPPPYPRRVPSVDGNAWTGYPFFPSGFPVPPRVLMIEESPFALGWAASALVPNNPTGWYWNIRVGDKIRINGSGRSYTIVGPCTVSPWGTGANQGNPELFVNVGPPGTTSPLLRSYYSLTGSPPTLGPPTQFAPEFLFVVNGADDDLDGYVDNGWDGYNNNAPADGAIDNLLEWEPEVWEGSLAKATLNDPGDGSSNSPSSVWVQAHYQDATNNLAYSIQRRPVPTPGAREIFLPTSVVIDATGVSSVAAIATDERSRFYVEPWSLYCDIMMNPNGQFIPTTAYSTPTSGGTEPFLHFWLTDKADVYPLGTLWGSGTSGPVANPNSGQVHQLPMPKGSLNYKGSVFLENDRRLVTLFTRTGLITTNAIESTTAAAAASTPLLPAEGFNGNDVNQPFYNAQIGLREALK
jgi:prepilin-type N-terminal cleavage/methylation domain-containing protein